MRRIFRVNSQSFVMRTISGYKIGEYTDEILKWIHENVKDYQLFTLEGHYSTSGMNVIAEVIVYEEDEHSL